MTAPSGPWSLAGTVLRPRARGILSGALLGALATACGAGLLSLAAWLLATAAQHPSVTALSVAVVLTRALGVGRGVARYAERLAGHDAALRALSDMRNRVYARLAATEPVRRFRSGDLVSRLVTDTDSVQDLVVRGVLPVVSAVLVGSGAVASSTAPEPTRAAETTGSTPRTTRSCTESVSVTSRDTRSPERNRRTGSVAASRA